jgi:hypothetical protein
VQGGVTDGCALVSEKMKEKKNFWTRSEKKEFLLTTSTAKAERQIEE